MANARSRGLRLSPVCSCCGKRGHRVETCKLPGAKVIQALRKKCSEQANAASSSVKKKDDRSHSHKDGQHRKVAAKSYGSNKERKQNVRRVLGSVISSLTLTKTEACSWLLKQGFVSSSSVCRHCGQKSLKGPYCLSRKDRRDHFYWRCARNACNKRDAFLQKSYFAGLQCEPDTLVQMLVRYANMSHTKAVVATDLVHAHGVSYNSADNFLRVLSEREAAAGKKAMSLIRLRQEIECDATSLGRFFVKPDNIFYADQIQDLQQKKRACLKSYPVHVRVVGAIQRGGLMVVKFMTPKVTLPKARPPVESIREIDRSGLAKYIGADKNTAIYSDGAPSWRTFAKKLKIPVAQVSHQQRQYAVQLRRAPRPKLSKVGGTQCIDAAWGSLKRFMPKQVKRKGKMKGVSCMNATLERRVYQWLWRKNLRADGDVTGQEFLVHLSKACRWK